MAITKRTSPAPAKAQSRPRSTVQPASDELLERISAFHKSPHGIALTEAEDSLENGIALASALLHVLEATEGSEHEATVLRIALEHLESAANRLDDGSSGAARGAAGMVQS